MSRGSRRTAAVVLTAAAVGICAAAGPGGADASGPAARAAAAVVPAPSARLAWTARIVAPVAVRAAPAASSRRSGSVSPVAKWNGGSVRLLVLESRHERGSAREHGGERLWLRVALPERPNGRSGWIDADAVQLAPVRWRVEVDVDARRAAAFRDGRQVRAWRVVVGAPGTVTPRGLFAVYERVRQPAGSELGPYALHLTSHSDTLFDYGGGRGRVALHGRAGALLADPLGSATSHGCVRMDSAVVAWLAARAGPGTPVHVR